MIFRTVEMGRRSSSQARVGNGNKSDHERVSEGVKTCADIRAQCYPYLDGALEAHRAAVVEAHLAGCEACARHYAAERSFLRVIGDAGRESAPAELRTRVEKLLESGAPPREAPPVAARGTVRNWGRFAVPMAAAAALALLVLRPWGEGVPEASAGFASDHVAHAVASPNVNPFGPEVDVPDPPDLARGRIEGLSECVIAGRAYAHYVVAVPGGHVSVFLALDDEPLPGVGSAQVGTTAVLSVEGERGSPTAILVSDELSTGELAQVWL